MSRAWHRTCPRRTRTGVAATPLCEGASRVPPGCPSEPCPVPGTGLVRKSRERRVVEGDAVAPEGAVRGQEPGAERARELVQRAPAGGLDLLRVARHRLALVHRLREED